MMVRLPTIVLVYFKKTMRDQSSVLHVRTRPEPKAAICKPQSRLSPWTKYASPCILSFPAFRTVKNKVVLFLSYLVSVILLQQPRGTKILSSSILHWLETEHSPFDFFLNSSLVHNFLSFLPDFSSCSSIIKPSPFFCLLISFFRICMKFIL